MEEVKGFERLPAAKLAKQLSNIIRHQRVDYIYLAEVFKHIRKDLEITVTQKQKKLPHVPNDEQLKRFYDAVWSSSNRTHALMIKTLVYTGMRSAELVKLKLADVDLDSCQMKVQNGKGGKSRVCPFPIGFKEVLARNIDSMKKLGSVHLFESNWKKPYTTIGVRKMIANYSKKANLEHPLSPHKFRHYLMTYLKRMGIDDALIQPYSGHESRKSLEIYSRLSLAAAQPHYNEAVKTLPI